MSWTIPSAVMQAWSDRHGPVIFTTVDRDGMPNTIYVAIVGTTADGRLAVCDNYFDKSFNNCRSGCKGNLLFMARDHKAYQVKGFVEYHSEGPLHAAMLAWADPQHPRKGIAILNAREAYCGSEKR